MPISNTQIYIIDRRDKLLPIGVSGELYIGGDGLARGYLNRPELTVEKFMELEVKVKVEEEEVPREQIPKKHMSYMSHMTYIYKTGDLARWLPGGNIECLGRIDSQVKLRGFRIELEEIERLLLTHDVIKEAVVIAKTDGVGDKYLCAYVVPNSNGDIEPGESGEFSQQAVLELEVFLSEKLPDYMIPSYFVPLECIPLTPNGKIDRKTLPEPEIRAGQGGTYAAPRNRIEEKLSGIWSEVLGIEKNIISIDANFFQMGGHSLKATNMVGKIYKELKVNLPLREIFKTPTIRGLSGCIKGLTGDKYVSVEPVEEREYYELSSAQKRLYILQQLDLDSTAYHMPTIVELEGDIDISKMDSIFKKLITRHEALRTSFAAVDGRGVQEIHPQVEFEIEYYDMEEVEVKVEEERSSVLEGTRGLASLSKESTASTIKNFIRPFDLSQAPLMRVEMIKLPHTPAALRGHPSPEGKEDKYLLMVDMHHIISDGISMDILVKEFLALYGGEDLPELRIQYKDFSEWQNKLLESKEMEKQEAFWLEKFKGNIPRLNMPLDFKRPAVKSFQGDNIYFEIGRELTFNIEQLNKETGTTLFMFLLAVYNVLFHKYTGQTDIIAGAPVSGRKHVDLQNLLGVFVNMIAFRNQPTPGKSFLAFLEEVKASAVEAYENQDYQFEELVRRLSLQGETGRNPIFDVGLVMQDMGSGYRVDTILDDIQKSDGLKVTPYDSGNRASRFDMLLWATAASDKIDLKLEYSTQLFKKSSMETFCKHFMEILQQVAENKEMKLEDITISSDLQVVKSDHVDLDFEFEMK
jgi:acyl carrier protein